MYCKTCHYSLSGLTEHRCPECGDAFNPYDSTTFDIGTESKRRFWMRALAVVAISYLVTFLLSYRFIVAYRDSVRVQWSRPKGLHDAVMAGLLFLPVGFVAVLSMYMLLRYVFRRRRA